jgi:MerR family transcriptional regulator, light-induced transcriptional regulator
MAATSRDRVFNVKAVVHATGLTPDTLRAWERRYGIPQPQRSGGRHRLYSQSDIDLLKWLVARQREGLSIARAVDLWRQDQAEGGGTRQQETVSGPAAPAAESHATDDLRRDWISACRAFDESRAEAIVAHALALYPPETVCIEVLQRGLAEIGEAWFRGTASVHQEHFASELVRRRFDRLIAAAPAPTRPGRILIGCPPDEQHVVGTLLLVLILRWHGWDTVFLGANVPIPRLDEAVAAVRPGLVILSAQRLATASTLLAAAEACVRFGVPVAFGGLIFNRVPSLREMIPGHFLGENFAEARLTVARLMTSPPAIFDVGAATEEKPALISFRQSLPELEVEFWREAASLGLPRAYLENANVHLARDIMAALAFGDISLLDTDLDWLAEHLQYHRVPEPALRQYMAAYHRAAAACLDERGQPVLEWLARHAGLRDESELEVPRGQ